MLEELKIKVLVSNTRNLGNNKKLMIIKNK